MYWAPPEIPVNPFVPALAPGAGPFQPFPGGPWFRCVGDPNNVSTWRVEIYANGVWTQTPQGTPNTTLPETAPKEPGRGFGRLAGPFALAAAAAALYDALKEFHDTLEALNAENDAYAQAIEQAGVLSDILICAQKWLNWIANDPLGQQFQKNYVAILSNIAITQDSIDRLVAKYNAGTITQADYAWLALLKYGLACMKRSIDYYKQLRSDYLFNCNTMPLPTADQVASFVVPVVPLEIAPYPTTVTPKGELATVPDSPPIGSGPLFPGSAYPKTAPLFPDSYDPDFLLEPDPADAAAEHAAYDLTDG